MIRRFRAPIISLSLAIVTAICVTLGSPMVTSAASRTCNANTPVSSRPTLYVKDRGSCVRLAQEMLTAKGYMRLTSATQDANGPITQNAVRRLQSDKGLEQDGIVGPRTWQALAEGPVATAPSTGVNHLPRKCRSSGKSICIVKGEGSYARLYAVQNQQVFMELEVRTGDARPGGATAQGSFKVVPGRKHVSYFSRSLDGAPMPYSMFFHSGQAIHYSPTFARDGYDNGAASHGCVNIRSEADAIRLFNWTPENTPVHVIGKS
jgi:lipoprotein-anchoring transpeptidase ErfK/SrfK